MSGKHRSRSKYHPDGKRYHPGVKRLISEGKWDAVKVLAAYARAVGEHDQFTHLSDAHLASTLLELQDQGLISLGYDEGEDAPYITLHVPEEITGGPGDVS